MQLQHGFMRSHKPAGPNGECQCMQHEYVVQACSNAGGYTKIATGSPGRQQQVLAIRESQSVWRSVRAVDHPERLVEGHNPEGALRSNLRNRGQGQLQKCHCLIRRLLLQFAARTTSSDVRLLRPVAQHHTAQPTITSRCAPR